VRDCDGVPTFAKLSIQPDPNAAGQCRKRFSSMRSNGWISHPCGNIFRFRCVQISNGPAAPATVVAIAQGDIRLALQRQDLRGLPRPQSRTDPDLIGALQQSLQCLCLISRFNFQRFVAWKSRSSVARRRAVTNPGQTSLQSENLSNLSDMRAGGPAMRSLTISLRRRYNVWVVAMEAGEIPARSRHCNRRVESLSQS
jgi:hypothetical protein